MEEAGLAVDDVPVEVPLSPTGATSRTTFTEVLRDTESGCTFSFRETRTRFATATVCIDAVILDGAALPAK